MLMPQRTIAQSAGIASLPTLSAQAELGQLDALRKTLSGIIRVILLLAIPSTIGLILIRYPLVRVLYERGAFTSHSTDLVSWALLWYSAGLVGHSLVEVLSRAFYALHDTKTPVSVGVIAMAINILLSFGLASLFERVGWLPLGGLALANSLATALESVALLIILRRRLQGLEGRRILQAAGVGLLGSALMGAMVWGWLRWTTPFHPVIALAGGLVLGLVAYAVVVWLAKVPEVFALVSRLKRRLQRKG